LTGDVRHRDCRLVPLTVDGPIYASSMVTLDSVRPKMPVPVFTRWLLGPGFSANVATGLIGAHQIRCTAPVENH
jgi:hypothetical protein